MLLNKVRQAISEYKLLEYGDNVLCAVSGGADSICLLHVMQSLKTEYNLHVYVANVNHLIRGQESDRDSDFVKSVCKAADVECFYREYDVKKIAKERKLGEEECGRILRYEFFDEIAKKLENAKIATAHNLNDNAETILFRLIRGSSAHGLAGISYKRENIIRPLLNVSREEIEKYLVKNGISWCEDETNKIPIYSRNKLRLNVIPQLNSIVKNAENRIVTASRIISDDDAYLTTLSEKALKDCFFGDYIKIKEFMSNDISIQRRIAAKVLSLWNTKEISAEKVQKFISFAKKETGKLFDINSDAYAEKSYDKIYFCKRFENSGIELEIKGTGEYIIGQSILNVRLSQNLPERRSNNIAVFDADKLLFPLTVRCRMNGDKMIPKGMSGNKKISDIFTDEKIERKFRDRIPLITKDNRIIYICGLRQSALFCTDSNTKNYIVLEYKLLQMKGK